MRRFIDTVRARFGGLRCRPGDVCWVQRDLTCSSLPGLPTVTVRGGTIVTVTRLVERGMWELETPITVDLWPGMQARTVAIADEVLIPLRDRPGTDETLTAEPKRAPVKSPAKKPEPVEA